MSSKTHRAGRRRREADRARRRPGSRIDHLAGLHVADVLGADDVERRPSRTRGPSRRVVVGRPHRSAARRGVEPAQPAQDERPEAVRVADADDPALVQDDQAVRAVDAAAGPASSASTGSRAGLVGEERGQQLRVGAGREAARPPGSRSEQLARVDEVAVVPDGERAPRPQAERRLGVLPDRGAGGGVAAVRDRQVGRGGWEAALVEDLGDQAEVLVEHQLVAVADRRAGRLLAAVLEREQPERGQPRPRPARAGTPTTPNTPHTGLRPLAHAERPRRARAPRRGAGPRAATSSASATRAPRSSAAPVAPSPASSMTQPVAADWRRAPRAGTPCSARQRAERLRRRAARAVTTTRDGALAEERHGRRAGHRHPEARRRGRPRWRISASATASPPPRHVLGGRRRGARATAARTKRLQGGLAGQVERRRLVVGRHAGKRARRPTRRGRARRRRPAPPGRRRRERRARPAARRRRASPTTPISGVGAIALPAATRCRGETLPPVTGSPSARQASPRPRTASCSCQNASGRVGIAEVEAVGDAQRPGAGDGDVAGRLGDATAPPRGRDRAAATRLVAVGGRHERLAGPLDAEHGGAAAGPGDRVRPDVVVVLLVDPAPRRRGWAAEEAPAGRRPGPCPARAGSSAGVRRDAGGRGRAAAGRRRGQRS